MTQPLNRRQFVQQSAAVAGTAAACLIVPRHVLGGPRQIAPSDKMHIAGIGVGGMGAANLRNVDSENIVALCDVDPNYASGTFNRYPNARVYVDYREMLDKQKDIDGVVIATPDHTHAVACAAALTYACPAVDVVIPVAVRGGTTPAAGVTATSPARIPEAKPRAVALPWWKLSMIIHARAPAAAATCVAVSA